MTTYLSDYNAIGAAYHVHNDDCVGAPTCNSSGTDGNCNDWFIDTIPLINADQVQPCDRLAGVGAPNKRPSRNYTDEGDFYVTFRIHVTRP